MGARQAVQRRVDARRIHGDRAGGGGVLRGDGRGKPGGAPRGAALGGRQAGLYREGGDEDLHYVYGAAHGDIVRADRWRLDYQLGLSALAGRETRVGPRLALETEAFPGKPFFVDAHNVVRYLQITPELAQLPNLDDAFKFARSLVTAS